MATKILASAALLLTVGLAGCSTTGTTATVASTAAVVTTSNPADHVRYSDMTPALPKPPS